MYKYFNVGAVVLSTAGREKGMIFLIVEEYNDFVLLADGKSRTIENPKKKNKKHLHLLCKKEAVYLNLNELSNAQLKKFLNNYIKSRVK